MNLFGIETDNITANTPTIRRFGSPDKRYRDWTVLVVTAIILLLILFTFTVYIFFQVRSGNFVKEQTPSISTMQPMTIDREKLRKTVSRLQKQEAATTTNQVSSDIPNPIKQLTQ